MEQNDNPRVDAQTTTDGTVFFPAIQTTSEEENAIIDALINQTDPQSTPAKAEESVYFDEESVTESEDPLISLNQTPGNPAPKNTRIHFKKIPDFSGVIPSLRARFANSKPKQIFAVGSVGLLLSVILLLALFVMIGIYAVSAAIILCLSLVLLLFCICLIAIGIAGLCYGIILLFTHGVLIGLIEIGLSMILFGLILALSALSGELATGQLPKLLKFLTRLFVYLIVYVLSYVFGSAKFTPKTDKEAKQ